MLRVKKIVILLRSFLTAKIAKIKNAKDAKKKNDDRKYKYKNNRIII